jgi:hypothetical protein
MTTAKPAKMAALFREEPPHWGLRGDPFLWAEMARRVKAVPLPESIEAARAIIEGVFAMLTGHPISRPESFFVKRYSHGGMSSGQVCPEFWRDLAVPLLLSRHRALVASEASSDAAPGTTAPGRE